MNVFPDILHRPTYILYIYISNRTIKFGLFGTSRGVVLRLAYASSFEARNCLLIAQRYGLSLR